MKKRINFLFVCIFMLFCIISCNGISATDKPIISMAYVEADRPGIPDPMLFTHLIYSFAEFNDGNDGIIIRNTDKLKAMADLKKVNPALTLILGIGGPKREGFSEMAREKKKRHRFVKDCIEIIQKYNLDGIDLDWEFPTTEKGGHTACPQDAINYGLLVKDLRKALGKDRWISFYSNHSAGWIDFDKMLPYVNYVNVSGYNLDTPKPDKLLNHQSPLYKSKLWGAWCIDASIKRHLRKGVPAEKILLGIPFYGRGKKPFPGYVESPQYSKYSEDMILNWDNEAKVPYYEDTDGRLVLGFDNEESISAKCVFIRSKNLAGAFVWHYDADFEDHRLAKALRHCLIDSTAVAE